MNPNDFRKTTVIKTIEECLDSLHKATPARNISLAITKLEEAEMWLRKEEKE